MITAALHLGGPAMERVCQRLWRPSGGNKQSRRNTGKEDDRDNRDDVND